MCDFRSHVSFYFLRLRNKVLIYKLAHSLSFKRLLLIFEQSLRDTFKFLLKMGKITDFKHLRFCQRN